MTNISPLPAADSLPHKPRLKPFAVRRHDLWTHPAPAATTHHSVAPNAAAPSSGRTSPWRSMLRLASLPFRMIAAAWRIQGEVLSLDALDDHLLRDMGLTRSEIRAAMRKGQHPHPDRPEEPGAYEHP